MYSTYSMKQGILKIGIHLFKVSRRLYDMKRSIKMAITIILVVVILSAAYPSGAYMETGEITQDINRKWTVVKDGDYRNKYSDPSV